MTHRMIICDIDGTIANTTQRVELAKQAAPFRSNTWWDAFFSPKWVYFYDTPIEYANIALQMLKSQLDMVIVYLSGRRASVYYATANWLKRYKFPGGDVILRPTGVNVLDFKRDAVRSLQQGSLVDWAFDDDYEILSMFEEEGIPNVVHIPVNSSRVWKKIVTEMGE